jgi:hypothetical protein
MARGKTATPSAAPADGVSNLKLGSSDGVSNQLKMIGSGPIKPSALQPKQLSKRKNNLKVEANY